MYNDPALGSTYLLSYALGLSSVAQPGCTAALTVRSHNLHGGAWLVVPATRYFPWYEPSGVHALYIGLPLGRDIRTQSLFIGGFLDCTGHLPRIPSSIIERQWLDSGNSQIQINRLTSGFDHG